LTLQDVQRALDKVADEHVYTARLIKQWLRLTLTWARKRGRVPQDVLHEVALAELPAHKHKHKSPLNPTDIGKLWRALDNYQAKDTAIGIRLLLLLFVRPTELREARWEEVDGATWRIPAKRTKMQTPHVVPLSVEAQALLEELHELNGDTPFIFTGMKRDKPVTAQAWHECLRSIGWLDKFTPHAARATASTLLRELGYSSDWIEAQLAHQQRDETRASYDFAEYLPQRREMLARWSAYVVGLAEEKVKPLQRKAAAVSTK
jgi:integrase